MNDKINIPVSDIRNFVKWLRLSVIPPSESLVGSRTLLAGVGGCLTF